MYEHVKSIWFSRVYVKDLSLHVTMRFLDESHVVLWSEERKLPLDLPVVASHCYQPHTTADSPPILEDL